MDRADVLADVVRRADPAVVLHVDHGRTGAAGPHEEVGRGVEGGVPPVELHLSAGVGVLEVDEDDGRGREGGRGVDDAAQGAECG